MTNFDPKTLEEKDQQQFQSALEGLSPTQYSTLLTALTRIEQPVVQSWLQEELLQEWTQQGRHVSATLDARGETLTLAMFAATPELLPILSRLEMLEWVRFLLDIEAVSGETDFARFPDGLTALDRSERISVYRLGRSAVYHSRDAAAGIYHVLPQALVTIPEPLRNVLIRCLQPVAAFDPEPLPAVIPFLEPTLKSLAPGQQLSLLERIAELARIFPAGIARLFRTLSRAYEEVGAEGVLTWIQTGEEIAQRNPHAAEAFFTLESRTSFQVLRHESPAVLLSEVHSALVKFMHMLCGEAVSIQEVGEISFPPPFAIVEDEDEFLPLPASIDLFSTFEENFRLYCMFAAHQAGRVEFGTYELSILDIWSQVPSFVQERAEANAHPPRDLAAYCKLFPKPEQIEALFMFVEGQRINACLAEAYPGLQKDLAWAASQTRILPPLIQSILPYLNATLKPGWEQNATVAGCLLMATELYASLPEYASQLSRQQKDEDVPTGAPDRMMQRMGEPELSEREQAVLQRILLTLRQHQKKKKIRQTRPASIHGMPLDALDDEEDAAEQEEHKKEQLRRRHSVVGVRYVYDEWDFLIEDYRARWCELHEVPLAGDRGGFFESTLTRYSEVIPNIKREFQQLRPKMFRLVKGLEDGEVIDLDAAVAARVDLHTGVAPSTRLYAARQPLERDVAALFLLDLSASTDARIQKEMDNGDSETTGLRVIDVLKEAVVVLSAALEEIGDAYAIYGFSSAGRYNIEFYPVKAFGEKLTEDVKGRISGLEPQRSTRMGAAVRHATRKLKDVASRAKILVLLSDGFPEDADYGRDENAPMYGLRDTMMALREAERENIMSFCLTIDKGGHDYLREMCPPSRYMVLEDIPSLPLELPKIYQRHIRMQLSE